VSSVTYHNQYCHYFAIIYEELILEGEHENYAYDYSEKYSELVTNIVLRREIHKEDFQLIKNNVDDYIKKLYYLFLVTQ
jgi:ABC-type dipeptide/oligopeptide/nickel transport system ATPase component